RAAPLADDTGGAGAAAAVDVGLDPVLPVVGALVGDAGERDPVAGVGGAVGVGEALPGESAAEAGVVAAAVDVGLEAVLLVVGALGGDARRRDRVVGACAALFGSGAAPVADDAGGAGAAAAVDVGLGAVLAVVVALVGDAGERDRVAGVGGAVGVGDAL